jgi:hypothetical protein
MTTPSITASLHPAIAVLAQCLANTSENYQRLLNQPDSYAQCTEAGRSLRYLSERYAQVVLAVWAYQPGSDNAENWEDQAEEDYLE